MSLFTFKVTSAVQRKNLIAVFKKNYEEYIDDIFMFLSSDKYENFIESMRLTIGVHSPQYNPTQYFEKTIKKEDSTTTFKIPYSNGSFCITVGDFKKMACNFNGFLECSGTKQYEIYLELFKHPSLVIYNPEVKICSKVEWDQSSCWITYWEAQNMVYYLKKGGISMEGLWYALFPNIEDLVVLARAFVKSVPIFEDIPDDELIFVSKG